MWISKRFNVENKGHAHWFLGMRIHQYKDGSHSLDQSNFVKMIQRIICFWTHAPGIRKNNSE